MKKAIALLLIALMVFSLASCGSSKKSDEATERKRYAQPTYYGDADGDGVLTILDATRIQRHLAGLTPGIAPQDMKKAIVSGGEVLSVLDATLIQRYLVGIIKKFPVEEHNADSTKKDGVLVVYFSQTGHTKPLAEYAAAYLNADLFEIEALVPYTDDDIRYGTDCRADREQNDPSARPDIKNTVENIGQYKTILVGYPIWHGQAPRIISTFFESYDLSGMTIIPFCTSDASPIGTSADDLHALAPNANWKDGIRFEIGTDEETVRAWIDSLNILSSENPADAVSAGNNG